MRKVATLQEDLETLATKMHGHRLALQLVLFLFRVVERPASNVDRPVESLVIFLG